MASFRSLTEIDDGVCRAQRNRIYLIPCRINPAGIGHDASRLVCHGTTNIVRDASLEAQEEPQDPTRPTSR